MTLFCLARSHIRPGWGNRPTSGALLPATRARISVSQEPALVNLIVNPLAWAKVLRSFRKATSWASLNPYMTSMVDLPGPAAVPVELLSLGDALRHPDVSNARTATAAAALA